MDKDETRKKWNCFINIIITQTVCMAIILVSVLAVKYFFKGEYENLKKVYNTTLATNTDINEVLK